MKLWLLFSFNFLFPALTWAAACCGGGSGAPSLILGDHAKQLSASYSYATIPVENVDNGGFWSAADVPQTAQIFQTDYVQLLNDRWQAGLGVPVYRRLKDKRSSTGMGDTHTSLAYEVLPDWDYNPWRPRGIAFLQLNIPTGKLKQESDIGGLDSRGSGLWSFSLGANFSKSWGAIDALTNAEIHRGLPKHFQSNQLAGTIHPSWGGSIGLGAGYNWKRLRFGAGLSWFYESAMPISGQSNIKGNLERYATASLTTSYLIGDNWSAGATVSDQTWFGSPVNTSLSRAILVSLSRRWPR